MKRFSIFLVSLCTIIGAISYSNTANAQQWSGSTTTTDNIYRDGKVGIGITNPGYLLDLGGRMRIRGSSNSAGIWFNKMDNSTEAGFVGMNGDSYIGFYGSNGIGWGLRMNVSNGNLGIATEPQTKLHMDLDGKPGEGGFDGIRIHYDQSYKSSVRGEIGYFDEPDGFAINSNAGGGTWADISFKTNGTTRMYIESNGNVGIGTTSVSDAKLTVNGTIRAEEIVVTEVGADYVFDDNYKLRSLQEVEQFIKTNKHLPDVAPAAETEKGIKVGEFNELLLQKVEELTLYMIDVNKKVEVLEKENQELKKQLQNK